MQLVILFVFTAFGFSDAFYWPWESSEPEWNGLKVTWGINPFTSFNSLPRTRPDAESDGWIRMVSGQSCNSNAKFRGERYWKSGDRAVILIFDPAGYIAGIQAGIPQNYRPNPHSYPPETMKTTPFVLDQGIYFITAYFVNPASLCQGRSQADFNRDGTGVGLWIQNGSNPDTDSIEIPKTQSGADTTMWTQGKCFYTMGLHYWFNIKKDMSCDYFFPVFLMYNDGKLNSFGWAFGMDLRNSDRFEHPSKSVAGSFIKPVPDCLPDMGSLTTLHIYMTDSVLSNRC